MLAALDSGVEIGGVLPFRRDDGAAVPGEEEPALGRGRRGSRGGGTGLIGM